MVLRQASPGPARLTREDPVPRRPGATVRRVVPPQHGAWAMLLVPYLTALRCVDLSWVHAPLVLAWLGGYLLSYYALLAVKTGRLSRVRPQILGYAAVTLPPALVVLLARPQVLVLAPVFVVLVGVNVLAARSRTERSLLNDAASVLLGCLVVPVVGMVAGAGPLALWRPFLVLLVYFAGTVLYVKTMIRNRCDLRYLRASVGYHAVALVAVGALAWPLAPLFGWYLVRAASLPRHRLSPLRVGLIELAGSVALLVAVPPTLT